MTAPHARTTTEEVLRRENLLRALKRVRRNKGAPGVDGMTVEAFPAFAREHWPRIRAALMEGTYRPAAVRRVWIDSLRSPFGQPCGSLSRFARLLSPTGASARWECRRCWTE